MKNLLWITDYTYLYFIDYEQSTFSYDISEIVMYLEIIGMLDAVLKVVLEKYYTNSFLTKCSWI